MSEYDPYRLQRAAERKQAAAERKASKKSMMEKFCIGCQFILPIESFNLSGHGTRRRARCKPCENKKRLAAKRKKLKPIKNILSTHGGSSRSTQKVVR